MATSSETVTMLLYRAAPKFGEIDVVASASPFPHESVFRHMEADPEVMDRLLATRHALLDTVVEDTTLTYLLLGEDGVPRSARVDVPEGLSLSIEDLGPWLDRNPDAYVSVQPWTPGRPLAAADDGTLIAQLSGLIEEVEGLQARAASLRAGGDEAGAARLEARHFTRVARPQPAPRADVDVETPAMESVSRTEPVPAVVLDDAPWTDAPAEFELLADWVVTRGGSGRPMDAAGFVERYGFTVDGSDADDIAGFEHLVTQMASMDAARSEGDERRALASGQLRFPERSLSGASGLVVGLMERWYRQGTGAALASWRPEAAMPSAQYVVQSPEEALPLFREEVGAEDVRLHEAPIEEAVPEPVVSPEPEPQVVPDVVPPAAVVAAPAVMTGAEMLSQALRSVEACAALGTHYGILLSPADALVPDRMAASVARVASMDALRILGALARNEEAAHVAVRGALAGGGTAYTVALKTRVVAGVRALGGLAGPSYRNTWSAVRVDSSLGDFADPMAALNAAVRSDAVPRAAARPLEPAAVTVPTTGLRERLVDLVRTMVPATGTRPGGRVR